MESDFPPCMGEQVMAIIKPWGLFFLDEIVEDLEQHGRLQHIGIVPKVDDHVFEELYKEWHDAEVYYVPLFQDLVGKPLAAACFLGQDGLTDMLKERKIALRAKYRHRIVQPPSPLTREVLDTSRGKAAYKSNAAALSGYLGERDAVFRQDLERAKAYMSKWYADDFKTIK